MGFLKRLFGGSAATAQGVTVRPVAAPSTGGQDDQRGELHTGLQPAWVSCLGYLSVVGESYRQNALRRVAALGREWAAVLQTEPNNPYDSNAVQVFLAGEHIGYLSADDAAGYAPVVAHYEHEGFAPHCLARIMGGIGNRTHFGAVLSVASYDACHLKAQPASTPLFPDRMTTISKEQYYQPTLAAARDQDGEITFVNLAFVERDPHLKKDSGEVISVHYAGEPIGYLTANKTAEYGALVRSTIEERGTACAFAMLRDGEKGGQEIIEAEVLLPDLDRAP